MTLTFAVIPSRGRDTLQACIDAIAPQVSGVIVIDTTEDGSLHGQLPPEVYIALTDQRPRNIQRWWNLGIGFAEEKARAFQHAEWDIVVLNDDVLVPAGWVSTLSTALRRGTAVLAYPNMWHKITGYAYMLRGEANLRADESFVWWYGDDDLEHQARAAGGVAVVDAPVIHAYPDVQTQADPELLLQTEIDAKTFEAKWSRLP